MSSLHTLFLKTFNKKTKLVLYWIILKGNTSRFGSAIQVLPSDIGEYLSSFFNAVVVVVFHFHFLFCKWKMFFFNCKFFCQKERLLAYFIYKKKTNVLKAALFTWCFLISFSRNQVTLNLDPTIVFVWNGNIVEKPL